MRTAKGRSHRSRQGLKLGITSQTNCQLELVQCDVMHFPLPIRSCGWWWRRVRVQLDSLHLPSVRAFLGGLSGRSGGSLRRVKGLPIPQGRERTATRPDCGKAMTRNNSYPRDFSQCILRTPPTADLIMAAWAREHPVLHEF